MVFRQRFTLYIHFVLVCCVISFSGGQEFPEPGSNCTISSGKVVKGVCKPLTECLSGISNLQAGVNPTLCSIRVIAKYINAQYKTVVISFGSISFLSMPVQLPANIVSWSFGSRISVEYYNYILTKCLHCIPYNMGKVAIVCCRSQPRVSVKKCMEYAEIFNIEDGPVPLLPPKFLEVQQEMSHKQIQCGNLLNSLIVGGRDAKVDEFPHMAAIGFGTEDKLVWGCGGTLISDEFVLTAAHCIDTSNLGRPKRIILGDITLGVKTGPNRMIVGISDIIKHPDYKQPSSYNDIALLKLDKKLNITRSILPACLSDPDRRFDKKRQLATTGWGKLGYAENQSVTLQAVNLTRFNASSCNKYYQDLPGRILKYPEGILRKQICAGDKDMPKDSCNGDSGGPLSVNLEKRCIHYVIGVTSFGSNYCGSSTPGVYTNVQSYLDWIEDIVWPEDS